jgi:alpha-beta hydrolase superfamily lysophospholipase
MPVGIAPAFRVPGSSASLPGRPLVLFAGLGDTAYLYRGLAPKLASRFRMVGFTRRGHGRLLAIVSDGKAHQRVPLDATEAFRLAADGTGKRSSCPGSGKGPGLFMRRCHGPCC